MGKFHRQKGSTCSKITHISLLSHISIFLLMEKTQLDIEISATINAIKVLKENGDHGALFLAEADLEYFMSEK